MAQKKKPITIKIKREKIRRRPHSGVKYEKTQTPKTVYRRKAKHPKKTSD